MKCRLIAEIPLLLLKFCHISLKNDRGTLLPRQVYVGIMITICHVFHKKDNNLPHCEQRNIGGNNCHIVGNNCHIVGNNCHIVGNNCHIVGNNLPH